MSWDIVQPPAKSLLEAVLQGNTDWLRSPGLSPLEGRERKLPDHAGGANGAKHPGRALVTLAARSRSPRWRWATAKCAEFNPQASMHHDDNAQARWT